MIRWLRDFVKTWRFQRLLGRTWYLKDIEEIWEEE